VEYRHLCARMDVSGGSGGEGLCGHAEPVLYACTMCICLHACTCSCANAECSLAACSQSRPVLFPCPQALVGAAGVPTVGNVVPQAVKVRPAHCMRKRTLSSSCAPLARTPVHVAAAACAACRPQDLVRRRGSGQSLEILKDVSGVLQPVRGGAVMVAATVVAGRRPARLAAAGRACNTLPVAPPLSTPLVHGTQTQRRRAA
jgi:hypothetical protein